MPVCFSPFKFTLFNFFSPSIFRLLLVQGYGGYFMFTTIGLWVWTFLYLNVWRKIDIKLFSIFSFLILFRFFFLSFYYFSLLSFLRYFLSNFLRIKHNLDKTVFSRHWIYCLSSNEGFVEINIPNWWGKMTKLDQFASSKNCNFSSEISISSHWNKVCQRLWELLQ